jgi:hypothetical protein
MNVTNSLPIRHRLVPIVQDHGPYRRGAVWADPDLDHAAEWMRWVVEHPAEAQRLALEARQDMALHRSPERIGRLIQERLEALVA